MLGKNLDPVILVSLTTKSSFYLTDELNFSIPKIPYMVIPIYLSESSTGIMGMGAEKKMTVKSIVKSGEKYTRPTTEDLTLRLQYRKGNVLASVIMSTMSEIFGRSDYQNYFVTVFYDEKYMLKGTLKDFSATPSDNTDLDNITLTFSSDPPEVKVTNIVVNTRGDEFRPITT